MQRRAAAAEKVLSLDAVVTRRPRVTFCAPRGGRRAIGRVVSGAPSGASSHKFSTAAPALLPFSLPSSSTSSDATAVHGLRGRGTRGEGSCRGACSIEIASHRIERSVWRQRQRTLNARLRTRNRASTSAAVAAVGAVAKLHGIVVRPADVRSGRHSARGASRCDEPRGCARLAATALVRHFGGGGCRGGGGARFRLESRKPHVSCTCGSSESPHSALTRVRPGLVSDHVVCVLVDEFLFANLHDKVFGGELS